MKKAAFFITAILIAITSVAQTTPSATHYREFKPSVITLNDGRQLRQPLTNIFLKNSSLLYMSGSHAMEANMENIVAVKFDDRYYVSINGQLGYLVDSIGGNSLYCIELFDQDTYERNLRNNVNIRDLSFGDQIGVTTVDTNNEDDYLLPVFCHYYMLLGTEFVRVHERDLKRALNAEQRTMMQRIMGLPDFSWQREESLKALLRAISPR
jgi:hypothetical protein